ncbi:MAG: hypothetical protein J6R18_06140 [Kiritimatiellae bacterium]|nr:hypothetical protein [Kiritimatiellia bacterium]
MSLVSIFAATTLFAASPVARIVPIDPILYEVDAKTGKMEFRVTGMDTNGCDIVAEVDGKPLGPMSEGEHELTVKLVSRSDGAVKLMNRYPIVAKHFDNRKIGRKLNNFVTEILREPLRNGEYAFENPREGWVFIGFDKPYVKARAFLNGFSDAVVAYREDEPSETMRWLKKGVYKVTVSGIEEDGVFSVRLVKPLKITARTFANEKTDIRIGRQGYGWDFFRKHLLHSFNTLTMSGSWRLKSAKDRMAWGNNELFKRGKRPMAATDIRPGDSKLRTDFERMRGMFANAAAYRDGLALEMDENKVNAGHEDMDAFAEAVWELAVSGDPRPVYVDYCDLPAVSLTNFDAQVSSIAATLNTGRGHGMLVPEMYLGTRRTFEDMLNQERMVVDYIRSLRVAMPSAPSHTIHLLGGWLTLGEWTSDSSSEADIKVLYDRYVHKLATDPEFADVGGLGMSTLACDEEIARWVGILAHHYCIEGRTDSLAERYGWKYCTDIVKNGDFIEGMKNWTVNAAGKDSITHMRKHGYGGKKGQCRMARTTMESGENFVVFTRADNAVNKLSQRIEGIKPGNLYKLVYATADYDDVLNPGGKYPSPDNLKVSVSSSEMMPDLSWITEVPTAKAAAKAAKARAKPHCVTVTHRAVFRAGSSFAELVFDDSPAAVGVRTLLNYISITPYTEAK